MYRNIEGDVSSLYVFKIIVNKVPDPKMRVFYSTWLRYATVMTGCFRISGLFWECASVVSYVLVWTGHCCVRIL